MKIIVDVNIKLLSDLSKVYDDKYSIQENIIKAIKFQVKAVE